MDSLCASKILIRAYGLTHMKVCHELACHLCWGSGPQMIMILQHLLWWTQMEEYVQTASIALQNQFAQYATEAHPKMSHGAAIETNHVEMS